jgi:hypothetical protein
VCSPAERWAGSIRRIAWVPVRGASAAPADAHRVDPHGGGWQVALAPVAPKRGQSQGIPPGRLDAPGPANGSGAFGICNCAQFVPTRCPIERVFGHKRAFTSADTAPSAEPPVRIELTTARLQGEPAYIRECPQNSPQRRIHGSTSGGMPTGVRGRSAVLRTS